MTMVLTLFIVEALHYWWRVEHRQADIPVLYCVVALYSIPALADYIWGIVAGPFDQ